MYHLSSNSGVIRVADRAYIPADPGNSDWQTYQSWLAAGNTPAPMPVTPPTVDDVRIERERRLALGFDYDFGDARGVHHVGMTDADMIGWDEVTKAANALMSLGQAAQTLTVVTETGPAVVTAAEWMQIILAATAARQPIWAASFALQAMDPIPADYADDSHWP